MNKLRIFLVTGLLIVPLAFMPTASYAQSSCVTIGRALSFGATGSEVTKLQGFLKAQGHFSATSVPRYGNATLAAVRAFQKAQGISQTGTVGPLTRAAISRVSCAGGTGASVSPTSSGFEVTGWIPYWRAEKGVADTLPHLDLLTEINPFVYTLKSDGTIVDNSNMQAEPWTTLIAEARKKNVKVIPTIMSGDGATMHALLSNQASRIALEDRIAALVKENNYDGIDIDFEGKKAETKDFFSTFLKGLDQRLGDKWLMCTIETRTPLESRYYGAEIPKDATIFANDLPQINKYCDRVRLMAYDQQGIDRSLAAQAASSSEVYAPVADPRWVIKVVELMSKDIPRSKMLIGVPTYGYGYDVTAYANNEYTYKILWTFNPGYAVPIAQKLGITPQRNSAGELFFTYNAGPDDQPISGNGNSAMFAAAAASSFATANNSHQTFRLLNWPDGQSVAGKVELAQTLGVRGVAIFKFDGGEDQAMWTALLGAKQQ